MIRHACSADLEAIITLCKEARDGSTTWAGIDGCRQTITANLQAMLVSPHHLVLVLERDRQPVGVLIGLVAPSWWHTGLEATDLIFYVQPQHRGRGMALLARFIAWAEGFPNLQQIFLSVSYGGEDGARTEQVYNQRYQRMGAIYHIKRGDQ